MRKIKAVFFDFDGTLVNTMPLHYSAYKIAFASIGIDLKPEEFFNNIGGKASETIIKFLNGRESPISFKEIHERKKAALKDLINSQDIILLETAKLLPVMAQVYMLALVSSGSYSGIMQMISKLQWESYFDVIITGEDVANGKPDPEPYLLAAYRLNMLPENCLVFEDTDDGIISAEHAGMATFDVRKTTSQLSLQK